MAGLSQRRPQLVKNGRIGEAEVEVIRDHIHQDGKLDMDDARVLVQLLSDAHDVCPAFAALFFPVLKEVILQDGRIGQDEEFYLLKMLYSDGNVRESEKQFLRELLAEATDVPPEFHAICETAFATDGTTWDVGGRPASV